MADSQLHNESESRKQAEIKREARALEDAIHRAWDNEDLSPYQRKNLNQIPCFRLGFLAGIKHAEK